MPRGKILNESDIFHGIVFPVQIIHRMALGINFIK